MLFSDYSIAYFGVKVNTLTPKLNEIMKNIHISLWRFMQYVQNAKISKLENSEGDRFDLLHIVGRAVVMTVG